MSKFLPNCLPKDHWCTPEHILVSLCCEYNDGREMFDPCPRHPKVDGLEIDWPTNQFCYVNPPYSRGRQQVWVKKCIEQYQRGCFIGLLLPFDTSTALFNDLLIHHCKIIRTFSKRIKFVGASGSPNFASALYLFNRNYRFYNTVIIPFKI